MIDRRNYPQRRIKAQGWNITNLIQVKPPNLIVLKNEVLVVATNTIARPEFPATQIKTIPYLCFNIQPATVSKVRATTACQRSQLWTVRFMEVSGSVVRTGFKSWM